jgi:hypothetical protein
VPEVVPPAPADDEPPADVVPPERDELDRRVAGLRAPVERDDAVLRAVDDAEAGFLAAALRVVDDVLRDAALRVLADDLRALDVRDDAGFEAVDEPVADDLLAAGRRAAGFFAAELPEARLSVVVERELEPPIGPSSSADTRLASPSTSLRKPLSSSSTRSSSTSRMRLAAAVTSFARPRVDLAPSADAVNVRSTAARTASTASAAPAAAFFELFLAMAARS